MAGGVESGVAFVPAVPGLAPGPFMRQGRGCPCHLAGLASEREAGRPGVCCHRSPQRKLGDCDVAHQLNRARLSGVVYPGAE